MANAKKSIKPIPQSMRGKKRYIYFELISDRKLASGEVSKLLWNSFLRLYGEFGSAEIKFWFIEFADGKGIIRCAHDKVDKAKAAILFLKESENFGIMPKILRVSGSLKKIRSTM